MKATTTRHYLPLSWTLDVESVNRYDPSSVRVIYTKTHTQRFCVIARGKSQQLWLVPSLVTWRLPVYLAIFQAFSSTSPHADLFGRL